MGRGAPPGDHADDWGERLRSDGYRLTVQRQLVLQAVASLKEATPKAITADVQRTASSLNITTVYRTLALLEQLGLLRHAHLGRGAPRYFLASDEAPVHLVCRHCGDVETASLAVLRPMIEELCRRGFIVDETHLALWGACGPCLALVPPAVTAVRRNTVPRRGRSPLDDSARGA